MIVKMNIRRLLGSSDDKEKKGSSDQSKVFSQGEEAYPREGEIPK